MTDIICVNDLFSSDTLEFYEKHNVITPSHDSVYSVRDVIINSSGETGILLEELVNPKVPINHPLLGIANMEPNWAISRFRNLDMTEINALALAREIKHSVLNLNALDGEIDRLLASETKESLTEWLESQ